MAALGFVQTSGPWAGIGVLTMLLSISLATEFMITILTPKFIAFFLIAWIIIKFVAVFRPLSPSSNCRRQLLFTSR